jgi:hypothetical protein
MWSTSIGRTTVSFLLMMKFYHIGASIKDLGKKWFAFTLMQDITTTELINKITAE